MHARAQAKRVGVQHWVVRIDHARQRTISTTLLRATLPLWLIVLRRHLLLPRWRHSGRVLTELRIARSRGLLLLRRRRSLVLELHLLRRIRALKTVRMVALIEVVVGIARVVVVAGVVLVEHGV